MNADSTFPFNSTEFRPIRGFFALSARCSFRNGFRSARGDNFRLCCFYKPRGVESAQTEELPPLDSSMLRPWNTPSGGIMDHNPTRTKSMGWKIAIVAVALGFCEPEAAIQATYYVSQTGSDANPGTLASPFQTIAKARDVVRTINTTMSGDIVVVLRGGTYALTNPVVFGPADGGRNGNFVRYTAYSGETPLITGGRPIKGWTIHDQARNIWKAEGVTARFRQLYVNNSKAIRARLPNLGTNNAPNFYRLTKVDTTGRALNIATSVGSNWKSLNKVEMHLMIAWADATLRLASTTGMGSYTKVKIQDPEGTMLFNRPYPMLGVTFGDKTKQQAYYLENAMEFLDVAGEWYLDESSNTLYYMPRSGENMATANVVVPMLENLLTISGTTTTNTVKYLSFQGLTFAHTTFMRPSKAGLLNLQAGQFNTGAPGGNNYMLWRPNAGVTVANAERIRFERNVFAQMAASGIDFISGTRDDAIIGNVFTDLGGTGITLGKFAQDTSTEIHIAYNPTDKNEISTRDTVKNNLVTKVTTEIQGGIGIAAGYPRELLIEHNEVSYTNYSGISVGFGWTKSANAMTANRINWNNIHHVSQLLADAGNIYTLSNQGTGSQIQYNYMHDISASSWADYWINGIYLDEGTSGYDVSHNVFKSAPSGVACNSCGAYTSSDNTGSAASTISGAGIESAYSDIKNKLAIPLPDFDVPAGVGPRERAFPAATDLSASMRDGRLVVRMSEIPGGEGHRKTISVMSLQGRLVARETLPNGPGVEFDLDFSKQRAGRYLVVLRSGESLASVPFVKVR